MGGLTNAVVRLAVGLGPWNVPGREAGETVRDSAGEVRERGHGSRKPWSGSAGETVGPWENPWESRGTMDGTPWEQVHGSGSGTERELWQPGSARNCCGRTQGINKQFRF